MSESENSGVKRLRRIWFMSIRPQCDAEVGGFEAWFCGFGISTVSAMG
jgi:hypothetical protein